MILRILLVLLALAPLAAADTITVPGDFDDIQAAVDAAQDGDTIVVKKGVYPGPVSLVGREGLVLRGKGKPVIDAVGLTVGLLIEDCDDIEVRGFVVEDAEQQGITVRASSDVTVRQCTVHEGSSLFGILVDEGLRVLLEKNSIEQTGGAGIALMSSTANPTTDSQVLRNQIVSTAGNGIALIGPDNVIERNVIEDCGGTGILLDVASERSTVSRNKVSLATGSGIEILTGDDVLAERNTITDTGQLGLFLSSVADGATTLANRIIRPGSTGILVNADGCELERDRVFDADSAGTWIGGESNQVLKVRSVRAGGDGFVVSGGNNEFTSCMAAKSDNSGFFAAVAGNTFTKCKAKGSGDLDLNDPGGEGANTYVKCKFGTSNLP